MNSSFLRLPLNARHTSQLAYSLVARVQLNDSKTRHDDSLWCYNAITKVGRL